MDATDSRGTEVPWKISGRIAPARLGPLYKVGTVLTALAMVLLPLIYLGLIGGISAAIYFDLTNVEIGPNGEPHEANLIGVAIGVILVLFMIKPLFARRQKSLPPLEITRAQEPRLFEFIDQICALVRSARPRRVVVNLQVNASASFTRGLLGLVSNNLTLTIGLPLATGLSVRELGGVFAHEFGHFAQGAGMRLTYLIRSLNHWFSRLVYQRDSWDAFLRAAAQRIDIRIGLILHLARLMVWLTRKILWVFMWAGHAISCFMLRQMEFDADHYETQVAGSDAFLRTCQALPVIGAGWQRAVSRQRESFAAKRLVDDLATYTALETQRVPASVREEIVKSVKGAKTGWFDTHPTDFDRMRAAYHAKAPGVLSGEESATALFSNFPALARQTTAAYYRDECEIDLKKVQLLPLEEVAGEAEQLEESDQATNDFFQKLLTVWTFVTVSPGEIRRVPSIELAQGEIKSALKRCEGAVAGVTRAVEALEAADNAYLGAAQAHALLSAGFRLKPGGFGLEKGEIWEAEAAISDARSQIAQQRTALAEALAATQWRLVAALRCYFLEPRVEGLSEDAAEEVGRLTRIIGRFEEITGSIVNLRNELVAFGILMQNHPEEVTNGYVRVVRTSGQNIEREVRHVLCALEYVEYPFSHARGTVMLADFLGECDSHADESVGAYLKGQAVYGRLDTLYHRAMGRLAQLARQAERAMESKPDLSEELVLNS